jgi:hypothetical protein
MKRIKEQVIKKILSFKPVELESWMKSRLHGEDKHFPINEGGETNPGQFLKDIYENIKDKRFRDDFIEILDYRIDEVSGYSREKIIKEAEYIYEVLSLCDGIKELENIATLYDIAISGDLKGVKAFDMDLHHLLLCTLATLRLVGDAEFWLEQMEDNTNKYYTRVAFYALLIRKYRLGVILKRIDLFIDRFKGERELCSAIRELFDAYGEAEILGRFMDMDHILTWEQREAVNYALIGIGNDPIYPFGPGGNRKWMRTTKKKLYWSFRWL